MGFIAALAGAAWYVAECTSLGTVRIGAAASVAVVAIALVTIGDERRVRADTDSYLDLRESVGRELSDLLEVAQPTLDVDGLDDSVSKSGGSDIGELSAPQDRVTTIDHVRALNWAGQVAEALTAT